jgi:hypothetical protein
MLRRIAGYRRVSCSHALTCRFVGDSQPSAVTVGPRNGRTSALPDSSCNAGFSRGGDLQDEINPRCRTQLARSAF